VGSSLIGSSLAGVAFNSSLTSWPQKVVYLSLLVLILARRLSLTCGQKRGNLFHFSAIILARRPSHMCGQTRGNLFHFPVIILASRPSLMWPEEGKFVSLLCYNPGQICSSYLLLQNPGHWPDRLFYMWPEELVTSKKKQNNPIICMMI
jgi:hypothetical protein